MGYGTCRTTTSIADRDKLSTRSFETTDIEFRISRGVSRYRVRTNATVSSSRRLPALDRVRGFRRKFVGPVIDYAWMQTTGIVNDHAVGCVGRDAGGG